MVNSTSTGSPDDDRVRGGDEQGERDDQEAEHGRYHTQLFAASSLCLKSRQYPSGYPDNPQLTTAYDGRGRISEVARRSCTPPRL